MIDYILSVDGNRVDNARNRQDHVLIYDWTGSSDLEVGHLRTF